MVATWKPRRLGAWAVALAGVWGMAGCGGRLAGSDVSTYEVKGQVFGVAVRSRGLGGNIMAGLRSLAGGEITEYTQLLEEARRHAVDRMVANATTMGANAVIMMRFDSSEIGQTMSEIVAYGTAVVLERM